MIFRHLQVVELASVLAGPSVGQFFTELGARVIKIENPATGGDVTRSWKAAGEQTGSRSAYFSCCNWGKESLALDLTRPADRARLYQLIPETDVVIASYKPGDAERLGVSYPELQRLQPRLVYGQISGYGSTDPRVGYDAVIQAEAGWMQLNGDAHGPPTKLPIAFVDLFAAHQLKEGLLLALYHREQTGQGDYVEVNLFQSAVASLANQATHYLVAGLEPARKGSAHPNIAPYGDVFCTADGQDVLLAVGTDRQFQDLWQLLFSQPAPEEFRTNPMRVQARERLVNALGAAISRWTWMLLQDALHRLKIPAGQLKRVSEALEQPLAQALVLEGEGLKGLRSYVGTHRSFDVNRTLLAPPPLAAGEPKQER